MPSSIEPDRQADSGYDIGGLKGLQGQSGLQNAGHNSPRSCVAVHFHSCHSLLGASAKVMAPSSLFDRWLSGHEMQAMNEAGESWGCLFKLGLPDHVVLIDSRIMGPIESKDACDCQPASLYVAWCWSTCSGHGRGHGHSGNASVTPGRVFILDLKHLCHLVHLANAAIAPTQLLIRHSSPPAAYQLL